MGPRVLGEDVEDQPAAVDDLDLEQRLERSSAGSGESSSSATSRSKPVSFFAWSSSSALPLPTYQLGSTWRRFCHSAPTTSAPAVVGEVGELGEGVLGVPAARPRRCRRRRGTPSRRAGSSSIASGGSWGRSIPGGRSRPAMTPLQHASREPCGNAHRPRRHRDRSRARPTPRRSTRPTSIPTTSAPSSRARRSGTTRTGAVESSRSTDSARSATPRSTRASSRRATTHDLDTDPESLEVTHRDRAAERRDREPGRRRGGRGLGPASGPAGRRGRGCSRRR